METSALNTSICSSHIDTIFLKGQLLNTNVIYSTADFLADRQANRADLPDEDDRNISDLQVDQVEFADVVVINKCDLVSAAEVNRIRGVVSKLNPGAKTLTTTKARLDVREIPRHEAVRIREGGPCGWLAQEPE